MNKVKLAFIISILSFTTLFNVSAQHRFTIDLNDISDDLFNVTVIPDNLNEQNNIFQFASIAPGTYQVMDIGRFVRAFKAYDKNGVVLETEQVSTNQWKLSDPSNTTRIEYSIAETWDTPVTEHVVYNMCGTSLENDHAFINPHAVLGYFHGMQSHEIWLKLPHPGEWATGTALKKNTQGYYAAPTYDFLVDSPILLGRLSKASLDVEGTQVDIYTYSKTDLIKSSDILNDLKDILFAASKFTNGLPVDRYVFLYHFEDLDYGAWEHSYSSIYAMKEAPFDEFRTTMFRSVAAHEFYHVVTPLNIHSELIEQFNYEKPELSQHLWLYEGVTEWAALALQVRGGIMTLDDYLHQLSIKLITNDAFDPDLSLVELGVNATALNDQYANIYAKGAVTAGMLDLLLLKKSKGKRGLREVINELSEKYGPSKPFDEANFFDELVDITYPEVEGFVDNYIENAEALPLKEYFSNVGINYVEFAGYDSTKAALGLGLTVSGNDIVVSKVNEDIEEIKTGDILKTMDNMEITLQNAQEAFGKFHQKKAGDPISFTFLRGEETIDVDLVLPAQKITHQFEVMTKPKRKQLKLRERWLTNLGQQ